MAVPGLGVGLLLLLLLVAALAAPPALLPEYADVSRARCHATCLRGHGTVRTPDDHVSLYDFYKPSMRCEGAPCQQCRRPCDRVLDSLPACRGSCDTVTCRDSCNFLFISLDTLLRTGSVPESSAHVRVSPAEESCQEVIDEHLTSGDDVTWSSVPETTLFIRWQAEVTQGVSWLTVTGGLPLAFLLKVRTRTDNDTAPWQTLQTQDAWLPLMVSAGTLHQFQVVPVLPDGVAGNASVSAWIRTHPGNVTLFPPKRVTVTEEVMSQQVWILVAWTPPDVAVCHYELHVLPEAGSGIAATVKRISWLPEAKTRYGPLEFSTAYTVRLVSCTRQFTCSAGSASAALRTSSCVTVTGNPEGRCPPEPPAAVEVTRLGRDAACAESVALAWEAPDMGRVGNSHVTYELSWQREGPGGATLRGVAANSTRYTVTGLSRALYTFALRTQLEDGRVSAPLRFEVNTSGGTPLNCAAPGPSQSPAPPAGTPWLHVVLPCLLGVAFLLAAVAVACHCTGRSRCCSGPPRRGKARGTRRRTGRGSVTNPLYEPVEAEKDIALEECAQDGYEVAPGRVTRHELLGEGAFGAVYRGTLSLAPSPQTQNPLHNNNNQPQNPLHSNHNQPQNHGLLHNNNNLPQNLGLLHNNNNQPQNTNLLHNNNNQARKTAEVAVKYLKAGSGEEERGRFLREIELMKGLGRHPHLVSLVACVTRGSHPALLMDYCPSGNLRNYLRAIRQAHAQNDADEEDAEDGATEQRLLSYARQVTMGMEYLANRMFVHRDLAARNILVCDRHLVKISDFGLTRDIYEDSVYHKSGAGKLPVKWMSVEAIFDQVYTAHSDVWSFGVVLWEVVTLGGTPYPGVPSHALYRLLNAGYRMERPENCSEEVYAVMRACWAAVPGERPSFSRLRHDLDTLLEACVQREGAYISLDVTGNESYYANTTSGSDSFHQSVESAALDRQVSCQHDMLEDTV